MSKHALSGFLLLFVLSASGEVRATVLPPGGTVTPDVSSNPLIDHNVNILDTATGTFGANNSIQGTYTEYVIRGINGPLTFLYLFTNDSASPTAIERATMSHFNGFTTDVRYAGASGLNFPTSATSSPTGAVIGFDFLGANSVTAGSRSDLFFIRTNATQYDKAGTFTLQGQNGTSATVSGFEPAAVAVPEPSALALTGLGGLAMVVRAARRRRSAQG